MRSHSFSPGGVMIEMKELCAEFVLQELKKRAPLFGGWAPDALIGVGAFACVFLLRHRRLPPAALKVIPVTPKLIHANSSIPKTLFAAGREIARFIELANHPHLVCMHNFETIRRVREDNSALMLIMTDYYPETLADIIAGGPAAPELVQQILLNCARGLEFMHGQGVIHRDIKPGNIFLDEDKNALIGDFGIALGADRCHDANKCAGTALYMPPEACVPGVFSNHQHDDPQLDIYALAMTGYKLLEGALPFQADSKTPKQMLKRRISGERITFSQPVPPGLASVLLKSLEPDPMQRFASIRSLRIALEAVAS